MVDSLMAGKTVCKISDWTLTNLRLQKVLYFTHMFYSGKEGKPLIDEKFQAWEYGPVLPSLYHHVKMYGKEPIGASVFFFQKILDANSKEYEYIKDMYDAMDGIKAGEMINISHWKLGAWYKAYEIGRRDRTISQDAIEKEYHERFKPSS